MAAGCEFCDGTHRRHPWTAEEIRALGVRTDLITSASIYGIGRTRAYELARAGEFPSTVLRVRSTYVVPVSPMLRALGIDEAPDDQVREGLGGAA